MFEQSYISFVPGPTQINSHTLQAMSHQIETHLHEDWRHCYLDTCEKMKQVFMTKGEVFLMVSSGTGGMESAISSIADPGEKILILSNGLFGDRIEDIAKAYHIETEVLRFPTDKQIDPSLLRERLEKGPKDIAAVGVAYSESQNGILNPVKELSAICNEFNVPIIVDTVSALGGVAYKMDEWGIDISICATQKCLGGPVGMAMVAVNDKSWKYFEGKKGTGFYFNLNLWRDAVHNNPIHPHPWSMSETMIFGLNTALSILLSEGLEKSWERHKALYLYYKNELETMGFSMFAPQYCACPTVISVNRHSRISVDDLKKRLKENYEILIGVGIYQQTGKIWRIGNMGEQARQDRAKKLITAIQDILDND